MATQGRLGVLRVGNRDTNPFTRETAEYILIGTIGGGGGVEFEWGCMR